MAERAKRHLKEVKRFDPDEVEDASKKARRKTKVFRKLKRRDITGELLDAVVHIVWPDNGAWYGATVKQLKVRQLWAEVEYTVTGEVEQLDLGELINDGQIAIVEARAPGHECGKDEIAYDVALKDVDIVAKEEGGGRGGSPDEDYEDEMEEDEDVEAQDEADDDSDASDGMSVDLEDTVAHRKGKRRRGNPEALARLAKRAKPAAFDDEGPADEPQADEEKEYGAAEQKSQQFFASVMSSKQHQQPAQHATKVAAPRPRPVQRPAPQPVTQTKSFRPSGGSDHVLRGKVRDQLQGPLKTAAGELAKEDGTEESAQPSPAGVAAAVEAAMHTMFGGTNAQYKSKARALLFNLRDSNNPQLRGRVLAGDIAPDALVQMTSEELASKELSQWRQQRAEEALKASVLDEEAAAQFSTAAALAQKEKEKAAGKRSNQAAMAGAEPHPGRNEAGADHSAQLAEQRPTSLHRDSLSSPVHGAGAFSSSMRVSSGDVSAGLRTASGDAGGEAPGSRATDWASIKAQAAAAKDDATEAAAPQFEDFEAFAGRQLGGQDDQHNPWDPGSPLSGEDGDPTSPPRPDFEPLAEDPHDEGRLGDQVWEGPVRGLDSVGTFGAAGYAILGKADWSELLANPELAVKGLVRLEKLGPFFEELRSASRHRTLSLALLRAPPDSSPSASGLLAKAANTFVKKRRAGVAEPAGGLEAYFIPPGALSDAMLQAAREDAPAGAPMPHQLGGDEMLLAIVHPKGWKLAPEQPAPQPTSAALPAALPTSELAVTAAPAATAPEAAAAAPPPPPPASPPPAAGQAAQPAASSGTPAASVADPRQAVGDPRQAATAGDPRRAAVAGVTDPGAKSQAAPAPAASPAAASVPVSGASGLSLADILSSVQTASGAGPSAASTSGAPQPGSNAPGGSAPGPNGAQQQAIAAAAAMPALPAGLDLSSISALAAALGVSSSALGAAQQPPAAPQPGPEAARDPRRDPRMSANAPAMSAPPPPRPAPQPPPVHGPGSPPPPPQHQTWPARPPAPITLPPPGAPPMRPQPPRGGHQQQQQQRPPPPPRMGPRPMSRAPLGGPHGRGNPQHQQHPPRGGPRPPPPPPGAARGNRPNGGRNGGW